MRRAVPRLFSAVRARALIGLAGVAVAGVLVPAAASTTPVATAPVFVLTGAGFGHGVGMSQWGAYGQAKAGRSSTTILSFYYPATTVGRVANPEVRVLLSEGLSDVSVGSNRPFRVRDVSGKVHRLPARPVVVTGSLALRPSAERLEGPFLFTPTRDGLLRLGDREYRGAILVTRGASRGSLRVINEVQLERYLLGVVGSEMPPEWPAAALEAQAVAARSYALANLDAARPFDLYADVRSQVYGGVDAESAGTTEAVLQTAHQGLLFSGRPATAFYSASSGGRTASGSEIFGLRLPYLVAIRDPWDDVSPLHRWKPELLPVERLRRALALPRSFRLARTELSSSGRPISFTFVTSRGGEVARSASDVRAALGIRSTQFRIGELSLGGARTVTYGAPLQLRGTASSVVSPTLERRTSGGEWVRVVSLRPRADGTFVARVRPVESTSFRIATAGLRSRTLSVSVAPSITLTAVHGRRTVSGMVRPRLGGAPVVIERYRRSRWLAVARTRLSDAGRFEAQLRVAPGTYRARVAPKVDGFVEGRTPAVEAAG